MAIPVLVLATLLCLTAASTPASLLQRSYVKSTEAVVSEDLLSQMQQPVWGRRKVISLDGNYYVKSDLNSPCPAGFRLINSQDECFKVYHHISRSEGWSGGAIAGHWHWVMQCGVHIASGRGQNNGNTKVHFRTDRRDGRVSHEDWLHLCKFDLYVNTDQNRCPEGYIEISDYAVCQQAWSSLGSQRGWAGVAAVGNRAKSIKNGGLTDGGVQCGTTTLNSGRTMVAIHDDDPRDSYYPYQWSPLCKLKYTKSKLNSPCPLGYALIDVENECMEAYNSMSSEQGWTGGWTSGTWHWVMQCGVHIASGHGLNNGNTVVHWKVNGVDGRSPNEDWVHLCKAISS